MSYKAIIENMKSIISDASNIDFKSYDDFENHMKNICSNLYVDAKSITSASEKQIKLCNDLIDSGASFDVKNSPTESVLSADIFIKKNYHLLSNPSKGSVRYDKKYKSFSNIESLNNHSHSFYENNVPSDFNIPNH